jgi:hypothetical protein
MQPFMRFHQIFHHVTYEKRRTSEGCDFTPYIYCIIMFKKWLIYGEILGDTPCLSVLSVILTYTGMIQINT